MRRVVRVFGQDYEVAILSKGTIKKVFRQEVVLVEDQLEINAVLAQMAWEDSEKRRQQGLVRPGEPRPVKPHRPGAL